MGFSRKLSLRELFEVEGCGFKEGKTLSQPTINRFKHRLGVEGSWKVFKGLLGAHKG